MSKELEKIKYALITKRALETQKIYFMYHEQPDNENDSGWRFFHGEDTQEYVDDSDNIEKINITKIIEIESKIQKFLKADGNTAYIRQNDYDSDFELDLNSDYSAHDLFIIHGYNGDTTETFGKYVKNEVEKLGFAVHMPSFPIRQEATYENWKKVMDTYFDKEYINENTVIVAHSQGTLFIPKYLAEKNIKIKLFISLAGFLCDINGRDDINEVIAGFRPNKEELQKSIKLMKHRYSIYSDNDHLNPQNELEKYADKFKAEKVFINGIGHMGRKSGIKELPQVIEIIKKVENRIWW